MGMPRLSIIVSVKDEEKHITYLLDSIASLEYPKEKAKTKIVHSRSTNKTIEIISRYASVKLFKFRYENCEARGHGNKKCS